jgi:2-methylcitrate dehydratase PrpD
VNTPIQQLAQRYVDWGAPGPTVLTRTQDALAALVTGSGTAEGRAIGGLAADEMHTGPLGDVMGRVATARLTELDDVHMLSGTTPGSVVVPTAVTIGAALDATAEAYGRAVEVGYDAMASLGEAIGGSVAVYRGVWPTYFCAPFAAAAVTASLLGLEPEQVAHALAIAVTRATGLTSGVTGAPLGRWLALGDAARAGCSAALAASRGFVAEVDLGRIAKGAGFDIDAATLLAGGGGAAAIDAVSVKPFPIAKQSLAATQAALALGELVAPDQVTRVTVHVGPAYAQMVASPPSAASRLSRVSSARWNVALALARREQLDDVERAAPVDDGELARLCALVEVVADEELARHFPARWPARVVIGEHDELVVDAVGDPPANGGEYVGLKWAGRGLGLEALSDPSPVELDRALRAAQEAGQSR